MSFGVGVMDIVGVSRFAWNVYKALRDSSGDFQNLSGEVALLHAVLLEAQDALDANPSLDDARRRRLLVLTEYCHDTLKDAQRLLDKHESLGTQARRTYDRLHWGLSDLSVIRTRLNTYSSGLGSVISGINNSSCARIDKRLAQFMTEVRAGLREGSVVTASDAPVTIDTPAGWEQLQRELEDIGIDKSVSEERREHISAWFKSTLQDILTGADEDMTALHSHSRMLSVDSGRISPTTVPESLTDTAIGTQPDTGWVWGASSDGTSASLAVPHRDSGYDGSTRADSVASMRSAIDQFAEDIERTTGNKTAESLLEPTAGPLRKIPVKKRISPSRLLFKLLQKDDAIIQAASDDDIEKVAKLIGLGVNVNTRDRWGWSALSMCGYGGHTEIARMLLEHGADLDNIDVDGESPEDLARNRGNREMLLLFEATREARDKKAREMDTEQPRTVAN